MGFAKHDQLYIGGEWVAPIGTGVIEVHNPTTEQLIGQIPAGSAEDMDKAVHAAAAALPSWLATPPGERAAYCERIGKYMMDRLDDLVDTIARELGSPLEFTRGIQTSWPIAKFLAMPALAAETVFAEEHGDSVILREGVGVVAAITPWNYPMLQIADKVAPALTAGCTVILKPSEITPLNAYLLAEAVHASGLPAGVFNLVTGYGPEAGEALVGHPLVDMVSFTGSTRAGRRISEIAAATVKATAMELGGKSPNIILDDFDEGRLREIVAAGIANCYENSGQTCSALTRMIVPRAQLAAVEAAAIQAAAAMQLGDPFAASTVLGPLVSEAQRERVRDYITVGVAEGARLIVGGIEPPPGLPVGHFVAATIFSDVRPNMRIAQEEIFGPVLSIIPCDSEEEAVAIANGTDYGLAAAVWSSDPARAKRVALRIRSGIVQVNGGDGPPDAPFGGFKQSGHGREGGKFGLDEFLSTRTLCI
ncbi:MAG: aldehyde dehydrogenase [Pseudonocardiales bacterium]|nr:aldehyde dehydrogenase [Pseudonocardiales bacterium]